MALMFMKNTPPSYPYFFVTNKADKRVRGAVRTHHCRLKLKQLKIIILIFHNICIKTLEMHTCHLNMSEPTGPAEIPSGASFVSTINSNILLCLYNYTL